MSDKVVDPAIEAARVKKAEADTVAEKNEVEALKAKVAALEKNISGRSEVEVLRARVAELEKIAPDPDAATMADLAEKVRDAIRAQEEFRTRKTTQEIDPVTGLVVTEEERVKRAAAAEQAEKQAASNTTLGAGAAPPAQPKRQQAPNPPQ
jgi:hypothetical protein